MQCYCLVLGYEKHNQLSNGVLLSCADTITAAPVVEIKLDHDYCCRHIEVISYSIWLSLGPSSWICIRCTREVQRPEHPSALPRPSRKMLCTSSDSCDYLPVVAMQSMMELCSRISPDLAYLSRIRTYKADCLFNERDVQFLASSEYVLVGYTARWTSNILHPTSRRSVYIIRERELGTSVNVSM